jgi:hypothetical protein
VPEFDLVSLDVIAQVLILLTAGMLSWAAVAARSPARDLG